MKVFQSIRSSFGKIGIYPLQSFEKSNNFNPKNVVIFTFLFVSSVSSVIHFCYKCETLFEYLESMYTVASSIIHCLLLPILVWNKSKTFKLFDNFDRYIEKCGTYPVKKRIYEETNRFIERWTRWIDLAAFWTPTMLTTLTVYKVSVIYLTRRLTDEDYALVYPFWFPFNWKTFPTGFLVACSFEWLYLYYVCRIMSCMLVLTFGSSFILRAIANNIKEDIISIDENWKANQNPVEIKQQIHEMIQNHADTDQLVGELIDIMKFIFTIYVVWSIIEICGLLLMITQKSLPPDVLVSMGIEIAYTFGVIFFFCEMCEQITDGFDGITDAIEQMEWYSYPLEIQRMLPIILIHGQKPVEIVAFGNIQFTRETFKRVLKNGFSFFTVFHGMM